MSEEEKTLEELKDEIEFIEHRKEVTEEDIKKTEEILRKLQHKWVHEHKQDHKEKKEEDE